MSLHASPFDRSSNPRHVWKRRKAFLKTIAEKDCPQCLGRGLVAGTMRENTRSDECGCTKRAQALDGI